MSTLDNPEKHKVSWSVDKFNTVFNHKADGRYLYIVDYFLQALNFQTNHFSNGPWLAGGTLRRLREGQLYMGADFDVFFKNEFQKDDFIAQLLQNGAKETFKSEFATTYQMVLGDHNLTIQAIHRKYYNMPSDVITDFDIVACQLITNGIDVLVGKLTLNQIEQKVLRINPSALAESNYSAISTFRRFLKMGADGYRMGAWHVKEFLDHIKTHPETINEIVSMSPTPPASEDVPF